jgi:hypothetical protein
MKPPVDAKRTVIVTLTDNAWPEDGYTTPGAVFVDKDKVYEDHLLFACPGCGKFGSIRADKEKSDDRPSWKIEAGSLLEPQKLTLSPSIHCVGCCGWHGFLKDGVFKSE